MTTNADDARPATQQQQQSKDGIDAVVSPPVLYSSHPPTDLVNSWNETRQARALLDQCREEKEFVEQQLSAEQDKTRRLERHCSELEGDNATLRAQLAAFELENHLPPGWVSRVSLYLLYIGMVDISSSAKTTFLTDTNLCVYN